MPHILRCSGIRGSLYSFIHGHLESETLSTFAQLKICFTITSMPMICQGEEQVQSSGIWIAELRKED